MTYRVRNRKDGTWFSGLEYHSSMVVLYNYSNQESEAVKFSQFDEAMGIVRSICGMEIDACLESNQ